MNTALIKKDKFIYIGCLSFSFAALLILLGLPALSTPQHYAMYSFAFCIPQLVVAVSALFIEETDERREFDNLPFWLTSSGPLASLVGLILLFFHFGIPTGFVFLISVGIGFIYLNKIKWVEEKTIFRDDKNA